MSERKPPEDESPDAAGVADESARPSERPDEPTPSDMDLAESEGLDEVDVKDLLRGALRPPAGSVAPSLLRGVQRRIRTRSRGKFYGDGWSTAKAPRSTYLTTSLIMLAVIAFIFVVLVPWGTGALP